MKRESKIVQLLEACEPEELLALKRFVASPYFNRQHLLVDLLDFLTEHKHDLEQTDASDLSNSYGMFLEFEARKIMPLIKMSSSLDDCPRRDDLFK